jgi:hypothetical protein
LVGYAYHNQHDLEPCGDHLPLAKILADGTGRGVVTTVTMGGCPDVTLVSLAKARLVEKASRAVSRCNRTLLDSGLDSGVQSKKLVELFSKNGEPPHDSGEKPRYGRST